MAKQKGNQGYLDVDGTRIDLVDWEVDSQSITDDGTTTEDNGFDNPEGCGFRATATFNGVWDAAKAPTVNPPNININTIINVGKFYIGDPVLDKTISGKWLVTGLKITSKVKGLIRYAGTLMSKGAITFPTANSA